MCDRTTARRTRIARSLLAITAVAVIGSAGCKTPSTLSDASKRPSGGVAQADKRRWTDVLRPRPRLEKVDVPVWEIPEQGTDVGSVQLAYGRWMERANNPTAAAEAYKRAIAEKPEAVEAIAGLARIDAVQGRVSEAEKGFQRALTMSPNNAEVLEAFGTFQLTQAKVDDAAELLLRAVELDPDATGARYQLGVARARQGRIAEARALFVATIGEAEAHHNIGILLKDSRPTVAASEFRQALAKKPSLKQAANELASLERALGHREIMPASHTNDSVGRTTITNLQ